MPCPWQWTYSKDVATMTKRTCPKCSTNWYSADTATTWKCTKCGAKIKPEGENNGHKDTEMGSEKNMEDGK